MAYESINQKLPFEFGRAIFLPFNSGPGSKAFVFKSMVFYALVTTVLLAFFGGMIFEPYAEIIRISIEQETGSASEEEMVGLIFSVLGRLFLGVLVVGMGMWIAWAMIESALHRRVLFGENKTGLFPWRLGRDEGYTMVCQLVNYLAYQGLFYVVYFLVLIGIGLTVMLGTQGMVLGVIGGLITGALTIAGFGAMGWVLIRLAPAAALSVAKEDIAIGYVWPVAKGRVWPAFGAYALHYILSTIVMYMIIIVLVFAFVGSTFSEFAALGNLPDDQVWQGIKDIFDKPGVKVGLVITAFIGTMAYALWMMCIAGIGSHLTELYLEETKKENVNVFN